METWPTGKEEEASRRLEHIWIRNSTRVCTHEVTVEGTFGFLRAGMRLGLGLLRSSGSDSVVWI